ncbi:hypothetical protein, partial [Serratia marcescens]|uniref:hypothetical protein n=1 Tax=Serratia marcescens TaxID=615 RepID=UPI003C6FFA50
LLWSSIALAMGSVQDEEALQVIQKVAKEHHANVYEMGNHFTSLQKQSSEDGEHFDFTCPLE